MVFILRLSEQNPQLLIARKGVRVSCMGIHITVIIHGKAGIIQRRTTRYSSGHREYVIPEVIDNGKTSLYAVQPYGS